MHILEVNMEVNMQINQGWQQDSFGEVQHELWEKMKTTYCATPNVDSRNLMKVCLDGKDPNFSARIYTMYAEEPMWVQNVNALLLQMDYFLEVLQYPMSDTARRNFSNLPVQESRRAEELELPKYALSCDMGKTATFIIKVLYRQNSTWQGIVWWLERKQQQTFRSALELLYLMYNAANASEEDAQAALIFD